MTLSPANRIMHTRATRGLRLLGATLEAFAFLAVIVVILVACGALQ